MREIGIGRGRRYQGCDGRHWRAGEGGHVIAARGAVWETFADFRGGEMSLLVDCLDGTLEAEK